jgi:hypothetical protein
LDAIIVRCHVIEMQSRELLVRVKRLERRRLPFIIELLAFVIAGALIALLIT